MEAHRLKAPLQTFLTLYRRTRMFVSLKGACRESMQIDEKLARIKQSSIIQHYVSLMIHSFEAPPQRSFFHKEYQEANTPEGSSPRQALDQANQYTKDSAEAKSVTDDNNNNNKKSNDCC